MFVHTLAAADRTKICAIAPWKRTLLGSAYFRPAPGFRTVFNFSVRQHCAGERKDQGHLEPDLAHCRWRFAMIFAALCGCVGSSGQPFAYSVNVTTFAKSVKGKWRWPTACGI